MRRPSAAWAAPADASRRRAMIERPRMARVVMTSLQWLPCMFRLRPLLSTCVRAGLDRPRFPAPCTAGMLGESRILAALQEGVNSNLRHFPTSGMSLLYEDFRLS